MLVIEELTKVFGGTKALDAVSLTIEEGQFVGIIGRSGAGKSTLLRCINQLAPRTSGRICWQGQDVTSVDGRGLREWRRRCAMIFQHFNLIGRLDVLDNVLIGRLTFSPFWRSALKLWSAEDRALGMAVLERMGIGDLAARRADNLSGGQQQRVAICRALLQEPDLLLADEPVASLDPRNSRLVMEAIRRVNRHFGLTILCNLHSLDLARTYCDRLVGMANGRVVFDGAPDALTDEVARSLYGIEASEVLDASDLPTPDLAASAAAIA